MVTWYSRPGTIERRPPSRFCMASLGHVAIGMAASRYRDGTASLLWRSAFLWASLSMLPDADVIGLPLGVDYAAPWGHRGATHSLLFAVVVAMIVGIVARWRKRSGVSTGLL